jgi:CTP synthase
MNHESIYTMGKLYQEILSKERKWEYLGNDVQIIPHMTELIKSKIKQWYEHSWADISIIEIGGTIGDIENEVIVESIRQLRTEYWANNIIFVHLAYIPYLLASKELKTKPTQNSVKDLRMRGIIPDDIPDDIRRKVSLMCGVKHDHVIPLPTLDSIYLVPEHINSHSVWQSLLQLLWKEEKSPDLSSRNYLTTQIQSELPVMKIAMIGKYVGLEDAYYSLNESLKVAGWYTWYKTKIVFIEAEEVRQENIAELISDCAGICIPWGFWTRGIEGMIIAAQYARTHNIHYLGICLGSQIMAIEFARNVLWYSEATSEEFDPEHHSKHHIIHIMESQKDLSYKWWTMRLGNYDCLLKAWTKIQQFYNQDIISERHRHRFEFNNDYRTEFENNWFIISGTSPDNNLVEMIELQDHPFMCATQAHPELLSRPTHPHPLVVGFIQVCGKNIM